jgi:transcriptional regulator with XRE-family HTH domain
MDDTQNPCGQVIETRRLALGMSQRKLAREAGISDGRLRQIEKGYQKAGNGIRLPVNPSERVLRNIARVLDLDADELVALSQQHQGRVLDPTEKDAAHQAFIALIEADPTLTRENKNHIINQHEILQRIEPENAGGDKIRAELDKQARAEIAAAKKAKARKRPTPPTE